MLSAAQLPRYLTKSPCFPFPLPLSLILGYWTLISLQMPPVRSWGMLQLVLILPLPTALINCSCNGRSTEIENAFKIAYGLHCCTFRSGQFQMLLTKVQEALWLSTKDIIHLSWTLGFILISSSQGLIYASKSNIYYSRLLRLIRTLRILEIHRNV